MNRLRATTRGCPCSPVILTSPRLLGATGGFPEALNLDRNLRVEVLQGYIASVILNPCMRESP
ncbi:MAG: hypothetical protein M0P70_12415 [Desulfobulbaceae bacterium]|nr:hypothetical protein [Desulfobulbaceae bacterium]